MRPSLHSARGRTDFPSKSDTSHTPGQPPRDDTAVGETLTCWGEEVRAEVGASRASQRCSILLTKWSREVRGQRLNPKGINMASIDPRLIIPNLATA